MTEPVFCSITGGKSKQFSAFMLIRTFDHCHINDFKHKNRSDNVFFNIKNVFFEPSKGCNDKQDAIKKT